MVPIGEGGSRRPPVETGYRLPLPLARRHQRLMDPFHGPHRRRGRVGGLRLYPRAYRYLDLLAREDSAHRLARAWADCPRGAVGEAWVAAARGDRKRSAPVAYTQQLLRVHLALASRYLAGPPD